MSKVHTCHSSEGLLVHTHLSWSFWEIGDKSQRRLCARRGWWGAGSSWPPTTSLPHLFRPGPIYCFQEPKDTSPWERNLFYSFTDKEIHETTGLRHLQPWRLSFLIPFLIGQEMTFWQKLPLCPDYSYASLAVGGRSIGTDRLQKNTKSSSSLLLAPEATEMNFLRRVLSLFVFLWRRMLAAPSFHNTYIWMT